MAPNVKQREFLSEGAVQVSQQVRSKLCEAATAAGAASAKNVAMGVTGMAERLGPRLREPTHLDSLWTWGLEFTKPRAHSFAQRFSRPAWEATN